VNLVFLLLTVAQARSTSKEVVAPILRAQALELVDDHGQVRSRLEVKPGAGEDGSGMFLADETTQSGVQIIARQTSTPGHAVAALRSEAMSRS